jgi:pyruvate,water dikinase
MKYVIPYKVMSEKDFSAVGGKNASLGELWSYFGTKGINIPDGFAIKIDAFKDFLEDNNLQERINSLLKNCTLGNSTQLTRNAVKIKKLINASSLSQELVNEVRIYTQKIRGELGAHCSFAIRSSATCEDSPTMSFAGLHDTYLNVSSEEDIIECIKKCYASLYNVRALHYRRQFGVLDESIYMSVGIQALVRSDMNSGSAGVCFTIDPDTGFKDAIVIQSSWGFGENIVQGNVNPDEFVLFKPFVYSVSQPIISSKLGNKENKMIARKKGIGVANANTNLKERIKFSLQDQEVYQIARWAEQIERHYGQPMDIEWARDGEFGKIYVVQARPETVHQDKISLSMATFQIGKKGSLLTQGTAVGYGITSGRARHLHSVRYASKIKKGEILVAKTTSPDWDPILKKASAIITERGGRTSHAAIVARELGALAIVGAENVFRKIKNGDLITVDNTSSQGMVYQGKSSWTKEMIEINEIPETNVKPLLILAEPDKAFEYARYPSKGVGLLRIEFIISGLIGVHPLALINLKKMKIKELKNSIQKKILPFKDGAEFFICRLSQGIARIAAAFHPKPVVVRLSDFKTDEYVGLLGGELYENKEENPMIGLRGVSRYYHPLFKEAFELECKTIRRVREEMGFLNVHLMVPFCRTVKEAEVVIELLKQNGLERGVRGLKIWMMCEIPSNVIQAEQFLKRFDGFSIGSNDLTQLILGVDRGNPLLENIFDENDPSVRSAISDVIQKAKKMNVEIGLCGQKPSDDPEFAAFLVQQGINSISFNPDALVRGIQNIYHAEKSKQRNKG